MTRSLPAVLARALPGSQVVEHLPLAGYTTYQVGGPADVALFPDTPAALGAAVRIAREEGEPLTVLGQGSNVLVGDQGVRGLVIFTRALAGLEVSGATVLAGAGVDCTVLAGQALRAGLAGLEFCHWLPGSAGGAAFMNARAFDQEMSQVWVGATCVTADGALVRRTFGPGDFAYKRSPLQASGEWVAHLELALTPGDPQAIAARMADNEAHRRRSGEHLFPSCGCVFKNDRAIGIPSGRLIDGLGLKGFSVGGAAVSEHHANFVINRGGATAADLRAVIEHLQAAVLRETGHRLECEVQIIGEF